MPFPGTGNLDGFDRASLGASWGTSFFGDTTTLSINGSTTLCTTSTSASAASGAAWQGSGPFTAPAEVYIFVPTLAATGLSFWLALWTGTAASPVGYEMQYYHQIGTTTNVYMSKIPAGTTLASTNINGGLLATDGLGYSIDATGAIKVYRYTAGAWNQTPIISVTDTTTAGPYNIGVEILGQNWRLDNLGGGSLAGAGGKFFGPRVLGQAAKRAATFAVVRKPSLWKPKLWTPSKDIAVPGAA